MGFLPVRCRGLGFCLPTVRCSRIPAGATPKDGPSAEIAIAATFLSLVREKPVPREITMTGELTLSGRILPVGAIKEKLLAARRAGVKTVVLPKRNEQDLMELPEDIKEAITVILVDPVPEVLDLTLPASDDA